MAEPLPLQPEEWGFWHGFLRAYDDLCRELERELQRDFGISKAEFSVLTAVDEARGGQLRIGQLAEVLGWDKGRVAHQVSRMEGKGLMAAIQTGPSGRRTGVTLTAAGVSKLHDSRQGHGTNVRRLFLDALTPAQSEVLREWSIDTIDRMVMTRDDAADALSDRGRQELTATQEPGAAHSASTS
ncbi:MarR family winged helix-turn-helix transcriptional regulator [Curtobacterium sp. MCPF17_011]|uniref:MarR family winged helix-turn-helix transcriptional regulator n=1 Tax=Curtobacterium sp. MCPF17_011 TaxID=2175652 RepID=UPI0015E89AE3|nr:MarR family winged helix-turn-helix transcriptional regulator [Curtobacterium sp. MCPF17_011]